MSTEIKLLNPEAQLKRLGGALEQRILNVLSGGHYILGPEVVELETALATATNRAHCITCANGTDALVLALRALGVGPRDAVLVPSFTFMATAEAVSLVGATPVFADVDPDTCVISVANIERAIHRAGALRYRGIIPVDLFGLCCDYDSISAYAAQRKLFVLSDAAQSFGARYKGAPSCSFGEIATTSFFPTKPLGAAGDGGALFTNDPEIAQQLRSLRTHGQRSKKYEHLEIGYNSRLDTLQAAILLAKLPIVAEELARRESIARRYTDALQRLVTPQTIAPTCQSAWAQYSVKHPQRDNLRQELQARGIPTAVYYPTPLHLQPAYRHLGYTPGSLPHTESLCQTILSLPLHPYLSDDDQGQVITAIQEILSEEKPHG